MHGHHAYSLFVPRTAAMQQIKCLNARPPGIYCKTGNFHAILIFANFAIVTKTQKLIFVNIFAHHYNMRVQ